MPFFLPHPKNYIGKINAWGPNKKSIKKCNKVYLLALYNFDYGIFGMFGALDVHVFVRDWGNAQYLLFFGLFLHLMYFFYLQIDYVDSVSRCM